MSEIRAITVPSLLNFFSILRWIRIQIRFRNGSGTRMHPVPAVLRIRDVYPGSRFRIFTHPDSRIKKKEGWKKICCHTIFCSRKFYKIENYFIFEMLKKIMWANFRRIIELLPKKIVNKLSKNMGMGFGIQKIPIPDPGSRGQKGIGSRIRNTGFRFSLGKSCGSGSRLRFPSTNFKDK